MSNSNLIANRLNWVFEHVRKPDGTPYTNQEVEDGTAQLGRRVTAPAIWKIRQGQTANPGILTMETIAKFFGVDARIFFDASLNGEELRAALTNTFATDPMAVEIAMRATQLSEEHREMILGMMRLVAQQEGYRATDSEEEEK